MKALAAGRLMVCMTALMMGVLPVQALTTEEAVQSMSGLGAGAAANIAKDDPSASVPKYTTTNANGALYGEGDMLPTDPGNSKITGCTVNPADPNLYDRQDCETVNFVMKSRHVRPNITVSTRDPIIAGNRGITNDPRDTLEKYKWVVPVNGDGSVGSLPGNACAATTVTTPPMYEERKCTFYKGSENFLCKAPLVVNVIPHFNYACEDTYGINSNEKCSKTLIVQCSGAGWGDTCSNQGFSPTSYSTDMTMTWDSIGAGFFKLKFGTLSDNYWSGPSSSGQFYDRNLEVNISGLSKLDKFTLDKVVPDDYAIIWVNDHIVYKTAPIIDRLEHTTEDICIAESEGSCISYAKQESLRIGPAPGDFLLTAERAPRFGAADYPNVDLRPFLVEGKNTIRTRDAVGDHGELYAEFTTRMACPMVCTDSWNNQCVALEQRAQ